MWMHIDDDKVEEVSVSTVMKEKSDAVAYVLFYEREQPGPSAAPS